MSFPYLITFRIDGPDTWLRDYIRGDALPIVKTQQVIVQDRDECERVCAAMANLKVKRRKPFGGSLSERWNGTFS